MTVLRKLAGVVAIVVVSQICLFSQEKNDAINAYNQGVALIKAEDTKSAIESMETCVALCQQVGDSANDIKDAASKQIPGLYYKQSYALYSVDKNMQGSIESSKATVKICDTYNAPETKEKAQKLLVLAYTSIGTGYYNNNENEKAILEFDSALAINPDYSKAILNKAFTYKKMNEPVKFGESIDLFITKVKAIGDTIQLAQANKLALEFYRNSGSKANQANKLADALNLLTSASKYGTDKDVYYQFASVYNKQKKFTEGAANAQKGLELETGAPEAKAKFYYELAVAQAGKGDVGSACESFKSANFAPFLEAVKAQRTNLKCK
jgi:tetratricopeptide (TPR) repeat protein